MHPRGKSGISEESGVSTEQISALYTKVGRRSEEHTSELQSHRELVGRLLLEKKKYT